MLLPIAESGEIRTRTYQFDMTNGVSLVGAASTCGAAAIPAHLRRLKGSCVGLVNTRENSVCKELGRVSAIEGSAIFVS